jgi:uncharacterized coiled-coil protein SlyX
MNGEEAMMRRIAELTKQVAVQAKYISQLERQLDRLRVKPVKPSTRLDRLVAKANKKE